jgi:hypothetical protein
VTSARIAQAGFAQLAVMIVTITAPLLAGGYYAACVTSQHDCDRTAMITPACCDDHCDGPSQGGPVESKVQFAPTRAPAAALVIAVALPTMQMIAVRPQTSPPCVGPLDLPTRFSTLLI